MSALGSGFWTLSLGGIVVGLILGIVIAYFFLPSRRGEKEFEKIRKESEVFQGQVHEHFVKTSELFQELNTNYRGLYEHLAKGAHTLVKNPIGSPDLEMLRLTLPSDPESKEDTIDVVSETGTDKGSDEKEETGVEETDPAEKKSLPEEETTKESATEIAENDGETTKRS